MVKYLSRHPDGATGVALTLIRISCALIVFPLLARSPLHVLFSGLATIFPGVIALALAAGFGTRAIAFMFACVAFVDVLMARSGVRLTMVAHAAEYAALVLLGPGAYSVDAMVFGRRVVRLDPGTPDRGTGD